MSSWCLSPGPKSQFAYMQTIYTPARIIVRRPGSSTCEVLAAPINVRQMRRRRLLTAADWRHFRWSLKSSFIDRAIKCPAERCVVRRTTFGALLYKAQSGGCNGRKRDGHVNSIDAKYAIESPHETKLAPTNAQNCTHNWNETETKLKQNSFETVLFQPKQP